MVAARPPSREQPTQMPAACRRTVVPLIFIILHSFGSRMGPKFPAWRHCSWRIRRRPVRSAGAAAHANHVAALENRRRKLMRRTEERSSLGHPAPTRQPRHRHCLGAHPALPLPVRPMVDQRHYGFAGALTPRSSPVSASPGIWAARQSPIPGATMQVLAGIAAQRVGRMISVLVVSWPHWLQINEPGIELVLPLLFSGSPTPGRRLPRRAM